MNMKFEPSPKQIVYHRPRRRNHDVAAFFLLLLVLYFLVSRVVKLGAVESFLPVPAIEYCPKAEECTRPDLYAFLACRTIAFIICAVLGVTSWNINRNVHRMSKPESRLFDFSRESDQIAAFSVAFQLWDLGMSLVLPEQRSPDMLIHHILATVASWYALTNQCLHYYVVFFLGCTEVSSIFLVVMDLDKFFPPTGMSVYNIFIQCCKPLFLISFIYYRVFMWCSVSRMLWQDSMFVLRRGVNEKRSFVLRLFLFIDVVLGICQLYWMLLILQELVKLVAETIHQ